MKPFKLFQYDKKVWYDEETDYTWQFGIFKNRSLLWVHYENPSRLVFSDGGLHILFSFFSHTLFGVDLQVGKFGLSFHFFNDYVEGFGEDENLLCD
jgi:hypothetical protein